MIPWKGRFVSTLTLMLLPEQETFTLGWNSLPRPF